MNITDSVTKQVENELGKIILNNSEIQFYVNDIGEYRWRDSRYTDTSIIWDNPAAKTRDELINIFTNHLKVKELLKEQLREL